jgi:hypothetical protein
VKAVNRAATVSATISVPSSGDDHAVRKPQVLGSGDRAAVGVSAHKAGRGRASPAHQIKAEAAG